MKLQSINKQLLVIALFCIFFYAPLNAQAAPSAVSTFHSIGLYWSPANGSIDNECEVLYRQVGHTSWRKALSLWFDTRNKEYRGSIVNLTPNTDYQIKMNLLATSDTATIESSTWSENFAVGTTVELPESSSSTLRITTSGTPNEYRLYTHKPGKSATIDVNRNYEDNITINANYIIIRGLTLKDALDSGIYIAKGCHHIVIEECDISGFGNGNWDGAVEVDWNSNVSDLVIQRNMIHDPGVDSNSWCEPNAASHPQGANAISFKGIGPRIVIRYNSIYSSSNFFEDAIMYAETSTANNDQDIYGNYITGAWDDCIQSEGAIRNVRIWGNFIKNYHHAITSNPVETGPLYIWRNISVPKDVPNWCDYNRGGLLKTTKNSHGKIFIIHNTMLWDPNLTRYIQGADAGIGAGGNGMNNVWSRNNIYHVRSGKPSITGECDGTCSFANELYNSSISQTVQNGVSGTPTYPTTQSYDLSNVTSGTVMFMQTKTSLGYDAGSVIPNFNDGFEGSAPDIGAHEYGAAQMEFGVTAYLEASGDHPTSLVAPDNLRLVEIE